MSARLKRLLASRRGKLVAASVVALVVAGGALAYYTSTGSGAGNASVGTIDPPTNVVAKADNGSTSSGPSPVTITWTAPSADATPTGYKVVRDNGSTQVTVPCNSSPCIDTGVPNGTYTYHVTSLYGDTWTSTAADSNSLTVQNQQATTTTLASSDNPSVVGEQVIYTATVSTGSGTPTGTVTFKDGTTTISCESGSSSFNGTTATCKVTYSAVTTSPHAITAVYSGDTNFLGSTSNEVDQVVNKANTTTAVSSNHNPSVTGQSVTYTATISVTSPGGGTPTGTVNFKDGGTTISGCNTQTVSSNQATCTVTGGYAAGGGNRTIAAVYSGDTKFATSTSPDFTQTVNSAATTTAVSSNHNPSVTGQSVTYTATISVTSPGGGSPTGTVNFKDGGTTISGCGTQTVSGSQATCTVTAGYLASNSPRTITAVYSGDTNFATSVSSNLTQTVNKASTATAVSSNSNPSVTGQSVTYTATISVNSPGSGTPTGTVNFKDGGTTITGCGTQAVNGSSQATCTVTAGYNHSASPRTITAVYSGDTNFTTSTSSALSQVINAANTSIALASNNNPSVTGQSVTYTATISVTSPGSGTPTGTVNFKDGGTTITGCGTQAVNGSSQATCTVTAGYNHSASPRTITAVYSGDTNFTTSTSSALSQVINAANTSTALASNNNPSVTGQSVTYTATVAAISPGVGTPTGTVNFTSDGTTISGCAAKTLSSGQATCTTTFNAANGSHTITAVYSNTDGNFNGSTATGITQTVNPGATTTALVSSKNPSPSGGSGHVHRDGRSNRASSRYADRQRELQGWRQLDLRLQRPDAQRDQPIHCDLHDVLTHRREPLDHGRLLRRQQLRDLHVEHAHTGRRCASDRHLDLAEQPRPGLHRERDRDWHRVPHWRHRFILRRRHRCELDQRDELDHHCGEYHRGGERHGGLGQRHRHQHRRR